MNAARIWRDQSAPRSILKEVWDFMGEVNNQSPTPKQQIFNNAFFPACDIKESQDHYHLEIDVPGIKKNDIQIELEGHQLVISGTRVAPTQNQEITLYRNERNYGSFQRRFNLPDGVDLERISADCIDGVLLVSIPKAEERKPKKINISWSNQAPQLNVQPRLEDKKVN